MQGLIVFLKRSLLLWLLLIASITSFDAWLVVASAYSGSTGKLRVGMPYAYYVKKPLDPWSADDPPVADPVETEELGVNVGAMGIIALLSTIFWPSRSPSKAPSMPSPVEDATPPAEVSTREGLHVAELDRRSHEYLRRTLVGSLLGLGLVFGGLGWLRGRRLSTTYAQLGRVPPWTVAATWAVGRGIVCAALVGILGLLFTR